MHSTKIAPYSDRKKSKLQSIKDIKISSKYFKLLKKLFHAALFAYGIVTTYVSFAYAINLEKFLPNDVIWGEYNASGINLALLPAILKSNFIEGNSSPSVIDMKGDLTALRGNPIFSPHIYLDKVKIMNSLVGRMSLSRYIHHITGTDSRRISYRPFICWLDIGRKVSLARTSAAIEVCSDLTENAARVLEVDLIGSANATKFFDRFESGLDPQYFGYGADSSEVQWYQAWKANLLSRNQRATEDDGSTWFEALLKENGYTYAEAGWSDFASPSVEISGYLEGALGASEKVTLHESELVSHYINGHLIFFDWYCVNDIWARMPGTTRMSGKTIYHFDNATAGLYDDNEFRAVMHEDGVVADLNATGEFWYKENVGEPGSTFQQLIAVPDSLSLLQKDFLEELWTFIKSQPQHIEKLVYSTNRHYKSPGWYIPGAKFGGAEITCSTTKWVVYPYTTSHDARCSSPIAFAPVASKYLVAAFLDVTFQNDSYYEEQFDQYNDIASLRQLLDTSSILKEKMKQLRKDALKYTDLWDNSLHQLIQTPFDGNLFVTHSATYKAGEIDGFDLNSAYTIAEWIGGGSFFIKHTGQKGSVIMRDRYVLHNGINLDAIEYKPDDQLAIYLRRLCLYASLLCAMVSLLVIFEVIGSKGKVQYRHMLAFNRLVSSHWVGRPVTFLRGAVATAVLSSARMVIERKEFENSEFFYWQLNALGRPFTFVATWSALECLWVSYAVCDIIGPFLSFRSGRHKALAAALSIFCMLMYLWTKNADLRIVDQHGCQPPKEPKFPLTGIRCNFGTVYMGSWIDTLVAFSISILTTLVVLALPLSRRPRQELLGCIVERIAPHNVDLLSLNRDWVDEDTQRAYIDPASCTMVGYVPVNFFGYRFVFDTLLWRKFDWTSNHLGSKGKEDPRIKKKFGHGIGTEDASEDLKHLLSKSNNTEELEKKIQVQAAIIEALEMKLEKHNDSNNTT